MQAGLPRTSPVPNVSGRQALAGREAKFNVELPKARLSKTSSLSGKKLQRTSSRTRRRQSEAMLGSFTMMPPSSPGTSPRGSHGYATTYNSECPALPWGGNLPWDPFGLYQPSFLNRRRKADQRSSHKTDQESVQAGDHAPCPGFLLSPGTTTPVSLSLPLSTVKALSVSLSLPVSSNAPASLSLSLPLPNSLSLCLCVPIDDPLDDVTPLDWPVGASVEIGLGKTTARLPLIGPWLLPLIHLGTSYLHHFHLAPVSLGLPVSALVESVMQ